MNRQIQLKPDHPARLTTSDQHEAFRQAYGLTFEQMAELGSAIVTATTPDGSVWVSCDVALPGDEVREANVLAPLPVAHSRRADGGTEREEFDAHYAAMAAKA